MKDTAYRLLGWLWIAVAAYLLADLSAAAIEQRLSPAPTLAATPTPRAAATATAPAGIPGELVQVLSTQPPEPPSATASPTGPEGPAAAASASPA
ncbi:MAG: hypothetical protein AB1758_26985, partial [Candidatus Eremiobacterota bacterium]